jgi:hypothetical protein
MSRTVTVILIYRRHKPIDLIKLLFEVDIENNLNNPRGKCTNRQKMASIAKICSNNSVELSITREATTCAANQELHSILWSPSIQYRIHKSPSFVPILSQTNPVHITPSYLSEIHLNIIHPIHLLTS